MLGDMRVFRWENAGRWPEAPKYMLPVQSCGEDKGAKKRKNEKNFKGDDRWRPPMTSGID
jgi:hypothetical protein